MNVPLAIRYFFGVPGSSLRNQPLSSTAPAFGLNNSIKSIPVSEWLSTSLMSTGATALSGSSAPGEPPGFVLARQFAGLSGSGFALGSTGTSENPKSSGVTGHGDKSSYVAETTLLPSGCDKASVSPPLSSLPV